MKRGFYLLLMLLGAVILISSCGNSTRTYAEKLKDERKRINKLIDSLDFVILDSYPKDGVFKENEFVHLKSGLYLNVVDSGNGNRAVAGQTYILCRFEYDFMNVLKNTTMTIDGFRAPYQPLSFTYGVNVVSEKNYEEIYYVFGLGLVEPLQYVGDGAVVKLIVPFKIGGDLQTQGGDPIYYKKLKYTFN